MQAYKVDHGNVLLDRTACKINKLTMQNKFRFSIGYLFYAPELEEPCFPFFLLVISELILQKKKRVWYLEVTISFLLVEYLFKFLLITFLLV